MPLNSIRGLVGDTGFWIAAFKPKDANHEIAANLLRDIHRHVILMPWPIMYEVLRTQMVSNPRAVTAFARVMREGKILKIPDEPYRDKCLNLTMTQAVRGKRAISLVDMVVREFLLAGVYPVTRLLTFNASDFHDVCRKCGVPIWPSS